MRLEGVGGPYAEAAHIRPLGSPHDGPDDLTNLLCLCPNDHVLLDKGAITISDELLVETTGQNLRVRKGHVGLGHHANT